MAIAAIDNDERAVILIICQASEVGISPEFYGYQQLVAERLRKRDVIYRVMDDGDEDYDPDPAGSGYAIESAYTAWAEGLYEAAHETQEEIRDSYYRPRPLS